MSRSNVLRVSLDRAAHPEAEAAAGDAAAGDAAAGAAAGHSRVVEGLVRCADEPASLRS